MLLDNFQRLLVGFLFCVKTMLAGVSFYGPPSTWRAGRLHQVMLLILILFCNIDL